MITFEVELTRDEIAQLANWHKACEQRCAEIREYTMADEHKQRTYLFVGLQNTAKYQGTGT